MPQCCVVGCLERSEKKSNKQISFHIFPIRDKSPARYEAWVNRINRVNFTPNRRTVVCSRHFENEDFEVSPIVLQNLEIKPKAALKKTAVPSKFLKGKQTQIGSSKKTSRKKISKREPKYVRQKNISDIVGTTPNISDNQDTVFVLPKLEEESVEDTLVPTSNCNGIEVQCELGCETLRKYWQPTISQLDNLAAENIKLPRHDTDSTISNISDVEFYSEENNDSDNQVLDTTSSISDERLFLVNWKSLKQLFKQCNACAEKVIETSVKERGCAVYITCICSNNHTYVYGNIVTP